MTDRSASRPARRTRWMVLWCVASVLALVAAFLVGTRVRSPMEDATANAQAKLAVTATVVRKTPQAEVAVEKGVLHKGVDVPVTSPGAGATRRVVTAVPVRAGDPVTSGDRIVEVSGRPSIALALSVPLYRDLQPGDTGDDVRELQVELARLGDYTGTPDGDFGAGTSAAVAALYRGAGSTPPEPSADRAAALTDAQQALDDAAASDDAADDDAGGGNDGGNADLTSLRAARDAAAVAAGAWLPLDEVTTVPEAGATVVSVLRRGTVLDADTAPVSLRSGSTDVVVRVSVADADGFADGSRATVDLASDDTVSATGKVTKVSAFRNATDDDVPGYDVTVTLSGSAAGTFADGDSVLVRSSSGGDEPEASLAVPLVALRGDGADGTYVEAVAGASADGDPATRRVDVTVDVQQDGWAFVTAKGLAEGDEVVIGGSS